MADVPDDCPHSTRSDRSRATCSLCQSATSKIVSVSSTGEMLLDGRPLDEPRGYIPSTSGRNGQAKRGRPRGSAKLADGDDDAPDE